MIALHGIFTAYSVCIFNTLNHRFLNGLKFIVPQFRFHIVSLSQINATNCINIAYRSYGTIVAVQQPLECNTNSSQNIFCALPFYFD